jgi:hypothetical protein
MLVYQLACFLLGMWVETRQSLRFIFPPFLNLDPGGGIIGGRFDIICGAIGFDGAIMGPCGKVGAVTPLRVSPL